MPPRALRLVLLAFSPLLVLACGDLEGETKNAATGGAPPGVATGTFVVRLAASGANIDDDIAGVNVTISEVTVIPDEDSSTMPEVGSIGPVNLLGGPVGFDLLALQGSPATLASGPVPVADYRRLRVVIAGASVSLANGQTNSLEVDDGAVERGIDVHVSEGQTTTVTVTINVRESVRLNRNDQGTFRPMINVSD